MDAENKKLNESNKSRKIAAIALAILVVLLAVSFGIGSGTLKYGIAYIRCGGVPISASNFAGARSYRLPTDKTYDISIFSQFFCTEEEAVKKGFHPSVLSDEARKKSEALSQQRQEEKRFSPEKINYTLYVPSGKYTHGDIRISSISKNDEKHSFFNIKEDGYNVASVREARIPSNYQLCASKKHTCKTIGKDKKGRKIIQQISERKDAAGVYSVNIGETFVIVTAR